jgi:hypothetical protein
MVVLLDVPGKLVLREKYRTWGTFVAAFSIFVALTFAASSMIALASRLVAAGLAVVLLLLFTPGSRTQVRWPARSAAMSDSHCPCAGCCRNA